MKTRRFFSGCLLFTLLLGLMLPTTASALQPPELHSKAALLMDANTGEIIFAQNEHQEMFPASLTKIITSLLVVEAVDRGDLTLDQPITATHSALTTDLSDDGSTADIKEGEVMTLEQYLSCVLVVSANEACNVLAETVAGSVGDFVDQMNQRAKELGCKDTHFVNTTGLHDPQHYTSAWDLYLITREALTHKDFQRICDMGKLSLPATNLSEPRTYHTTNFLIDTWRSVGYFNRDAHGVKTGHTSDAGYCLVSSATRGSMKLISVVLGGDRVTLPDGEIRTYSFYDTNLLFNWAFDHFSYRTLLSEDQIIEREVEVALSKVDHVTIHPAQEVSALLPKDLEPDQLEQTVTLNKEPVNAPISEGDVLGKLTLSHDGTTYAEVDLLAFHDVEASPLLVFWSKIQQFFDQTLVRILCGLVLAVLVGALLWKLTLGRRRYRYGRSVSGRSSRGYRGRRR